MASYGIGFKIDKKRKNLARNIKPKSGTDEVKGSWTTWHRVTVTSQNVPESFLYTLIIDGKIHYKNGSIDVCFMLLVLPRHKYLRRKVRLNRCLYDLVIDKVDMTSQSPTWGENNMETI